MSVDTTFQPKSPTVLVGVTAVQATPDTQSGVQTFRVRCLIATSTYLSWGTSNSVTAKGAPAAGVPVMNTLGMSVAGSVMYIEVPGNSWFISSAAAGFEVTGGQGGVGG